MIGIIKGEELREEMKREEDKLYKEEQIKRLIAEGKNMSQIAKEIGINRSTISRSYKHLF